MVSPKYVLLVMLDQVKAQMEARPHPRPALHLRRPSHWPPPLAGQGLQQPRCGRQHQRTGAGWRLGMRGGRGARADKGPPAGYSQLADTVCLAVEGLQPVARRLA